jgi:hypothetical protein
MWWLTFAGIAVTAVGSLAAAMALFGVGGAERPDPGTQADPPRGTSPAAEPSGKSAPAAPSFTYLSTVLPQAGAGNLISLPRDLRDDPAYARAVAVGCPSNGSTDKVREVTYPLRGRYLDFSATVRPAFTTEPDSRAHVFAVATYQEADGTVTRRAVGQQLGAAGTTTGPIEADIEGAVQLTLRVKCEHPEGMVIISDGRLIR